MTAGLFLFVAGLYCYYSASSLILVDGKPPAPAAVDEKNVFPHDCTSPLASVIKVMNTSADPCDNFYNFACGRFKLYNTITPGDNKISQFTKNDFALMSKARAVLERPPSEATLKSSARQKVRAYYQSCIDTNATNHNGVVNMRRMVKQLGGVWFSDDKSSSSFDLTAELTRLSAFTPSGLFYWGVSPDLVNSSTYSIQIHQGGLGMGSDTRDYYLHNNATVDKDPVLTAYVDQLMSYWEIIFNDDDSQVDDDDSAEIVNFAAWDASFVEQVVHFEQQLAAIHLPKHEIRNLSSIYSTATICWLNENAGFINWTRFFQVPLNEVGIQIDETEIIGVHATPYFLSLTKLMENVTATEAGRRVVHNYLVFRAIVDYAKYFGEQFREVHAEFSRTFEGAVGMTATWHHCVSDTDSTIGFPLGAMYLDDYFSVDDKSHVVNVTKNVLDSFYQRVENATWMLNETRQFALKKLRALIYDIGYPDWILNTTYLDDRYENLTVTNDYTLNQFYAFNYTFKQELQKLRRVEDCRYEWYMTPQTANAYYASHQNKFVMPAGLLEPPFYYKDSNIPAALNYGAIGSIVSHEICHSIDDRGREYDEYGHFREWWDAVTSERFLERAQCLIDQYDKYKVGELKVRGAQTVGENIADNGAVQTAFSAYKIAAEKSRQSLVDICGLNFTSDQLFFIGFAQMWCASYSPEALRLSVLQDEHPPSFIRVTGALSNFDQFSEAFQCRLGSAMNPENKCVFW